jgi:hypothetical protein
VPLIDCLSLSEDDNRLAEMVRDRFTISVFVSLAAWGGM